jgi:hypothetical protein
MPNRRRHSLKPSLDEFGDRCLDPQDRGLVKHGHSATKER